MEIKPVENAAPPAYPAADGAETRMLLATHVPDRWRKAKRLAGALAVAMAANLSDGCGSTVNDSRVPERPLPVCVPPAGTEQNSLVADVSNWIRSVYSQPSAAVWVPPPMPAHSPPQAAIGGGIRAPLPPVSEEGPGIGPSRP
jgi:hypothetical protein